MGPDRGVVWGEVVQRLRCLSWRAAGAAVAVPLVLIGGYLALRPDPRAAAVVLPRATDVPALATSTPPEPAGTLGAPVIVVHAAGAVVRPGVYRLPDAARVIDLLNVAGGPGAGADLSGINLAAPLMDGALVRFPAAGEDPPPVVDIVEAAPELPSPARPAAAAGVGELLDVNMASATELERLPGIGPVIAAAIVEHRDRLGPFRSVEALADVSGIGPVKLDAIGDLVTVTP